MEPPASSADKLDNLKASDAAVKDIMFDSGSARTYSVSTATTMQYTPTPLAEVTKLTLKPPMNLPPLGSARYMLQRRLAGQPDGAADGTALTVTDDATRPIAVKCKQQGTAAKLKGCLAGGAAELLQVCVLVTDCLHAPLAADRQ